MNYLAAGYYVYDSMRHIAFSFLPESAAILWGSRKVTVSTSKQQVILKELNELKSALCREAGIDPAHVQLQISTDPHSFISLGNASKAIIRVSEAITKAQAEKAKSYEYYRMAYENLLNNIPDDPQEMLKKIHTMTDFELHQILGLHDKCVYDLSSDELRYALGHEIKGHTKHNDNRTKAILYITASLTVLIAQRMFSSVSGMGLAASICIGKLAVALLNHSFETRSDLDSIRNDSVAQAGASEYLKKAAICEIARRELQQRKSESKGLCAVISTALAWVSGLDYPTDEARYARVRQQVELETPLAQ